MALKMMTKPKQVKPTPVIAQEVIQITPTVTVAPATVENLIEANDQIDKLEAKLKPLTVVYDQARAEISNALDEGGFSAAEGIEFVYNGKVIKLGKKGEERRVAVSMKKIQLLLDAVKPGLFYDLVKVNLGDLEKYLTPEQMTAVTLTENTRKRVVKIS